MLRPVWADPCPLNPTETAWAIFQHRAAFVVMDELKSTGETLEQFAQRIGEDESWLRRKLHGQTPADLGDVMGWVLAIGVHVLPVFDSLLELKTV